MNTLNTLNICPRCSNPLLHHFGNHREYWFCRHCWQEMSDLELANHQRSEKFSKIILYGQHRRVKSKPGEGLRKVFS